MRGVSDGLGRAVVAAPVTISNCDELRYGLVSFQGFVLGRELIIWLATNRRADSRLRDEEAFDVAMPLRIDRP